LIDIPEDVFRTLSIKAAAMGINLKKYIEQLLVEKAN
jgi:predicted HicB family RNase H-like nuclease